MSVGAETRPAATCAIGETAYIRESASGVGTGHPRSEGVAAAAAAAATAVVLPAFLGVEKPAFVAAAAPVPSGTPSALAPAPAGEEEEDSGTTGPNGAYAPMPSASTQHL